MTGGREVCLGNGGLRVERRAGMEGMGGGRAEGIGAEGVGGRSKKTGVDQ